MPASPWRLALGRPHASGMGEGKTTMRINSNAGRYTAAATYTGKSIADGGRLTIVSPAGRRHDLAFTQAGSAFEVAQGIGKSPDEAREITAAILDALRVAIFAHFSAPMMGA